MTGPEHLRVHRLGRCDYEPIWRSMETFTTERGPDTCDEIWLLEHPPIYTLGRNARPHHLLDPGTIPVVHVDRGGQITYHGPGQLIAYTLIDIRRRGLGVRHLVDTLEQSVVTLLAEFGVSAAARADAPGVYVEGAKIASLGLRIRRGCSYHGLSLNVDMDLQPFQRINPCGYPGLAITQLSDLGVRVPLYEVGERWVGLLAARLGYNVLETPG